MSNSDNAVAWFHCGKCGSLFEAVPGYSEERRCSECERPPETGLWPSVNVSPETDVETEGIPVPAEEATKRNFRKKGKKNMVMRFIVAWLFIMAIAVWIRLHYVRLGEEEESRKQAHLDLVEGTIADQKTALLNEALPDCHRSLVGFLKGKTVRERNSFVFGSASNASRMETFYELNPMENVDLSKIQRVAQEPLVVGDEEIIYTRWEGEEGTAFDAVFRNEGGEWKLDWEHFVRYSDYPWGLFLNGLGPDEGEFRLLARMLPDEDTGQESSGPTTLELLAPVFGKPSETGDSSQKFKLERRGDAGLLLGAAFGAQAEGEVLFGSKEKAMEPEGLLRVRVRVRREMIGEDFKFYLEEVVACHWISSSERGYDLIKLRYDIFGE